jgi:Na+/H+ antiporter NhaD/arsenite permease-like protein
MFAVLTMEPDMSSGQWLLITLTCGVGGSMLSIGSAAGVALMGQAKGLYNFFGSLQMDVGDCTRVRSEHPYSHADR